MIVKRPNTLSQNSSLRCIGLFFVFFFCCTSQIQSQSTDLARLEYTYFPQSNSDNSFRRFRSLLNVPIPLWEDCYFVVGGEYRNINLQLEDPFPFRTGNKDRFQSFKISLGYTAKFGSDWRYAVKVSGMATSNFETKLTRDDYVFGAAAFVIKDMTGDDKVQSGGVPWRLILGLNYDTQAGRPFPLPIINYFRKFHPSWSYTLGVPKTNLKYYLSKKNVLQVFTTLDGFYANIQQDFDVGNGDIADTISMTTVLSGLGYEYYLTDHLLLYLYAGHTLLNDIRLRDTKDNDVRTLNDKNSFYGRTGIKFKI